jgi:DNA repair protein RadC
MHENHRDRLRDRFLAEGLESFEPHQALELLLFYCIPRRDTNELAHRLIEHFGSIAGVFDAHSAELESIEGIGKNASVLLSLMKPLWRLYRQESSRNGLSMDNFRTASSYAVDLFAGRTNEAFYVLCLDPSCRLIRQVLLHEGTVNEVSVHPRTVVETVIRNNASQVILVHNHPKGLLEPSANDIAYTRRLTIALSTIGISIIDHIIVSGEETYSFAREGRMEKILREVEIRVTQDVSGYIKENSQSPRDYKELSAFVKTYSDQ